MTEMESCPAQWPAVGTLRQLWMCDLFAGHEGDHIAYWLGSDKPRASYPNWAHAVRAGTPHP